IERSKLTYVSPACPQVFSDRPIYTSTAYLFDYHHAGEDLGYVEFHYDKHSDINWIVVRHGVNQFLDHWSSILSYGWPQADALTKTYPVTQRQVNLTPALRDMQI